MGGQSFELYGFWSERTGRVCLVGSAQVLSASGSYYKPFDARLVLSYSNESNIYGSLVKGALESVSNQSGFETVSILGARNTPLNYEYKLLERSRSECGANSEESLSGESVVGGLCKVFEGRSHMYRTDDCGSNHRSCGVEYVSLLSLLCDGEKMRVVLSLSNASSVGRLFSFDPRSALVAEGAWDVERNRFCGAACRILNFTDSLSDAVIGDCSLRLSLRFPASLSIKSMAPVVGELWRSNNKTRIEFKSVNEPLWRFSGLRYEYTERERVSKLCESRSKSKGKKHYPDAQTSDMRFVMSVRYSGGGGGGENVLRSARASPYFVGDRLYRDLLVRGQGAAGVISGIPVNVVTKSFTNITYKIRFLNPVSESRGDIYAEGTYDRDTGELCMVGCQSVKLINSTVEDCSLAIRFKFSPVDSRSDDRLKGTIESTREKTDPLYVGRMEVVSRSIYVHQAKESVWRMDLEIAMVLISNTLSCLFVGLQLYHMNKHQETLPFISVTMLTLLVLGHMIPLLLNFEELFKSGNNQESLFFENDRWLEAKEIVVRIVTMIAFLLECRLLQLAWSARRTPEQQQHRDNVWNAEKMVSYVCLPLYIIGGLIAWLVNRNRTPKRVVYIGKPRSSRNLLYRPLTLKRSFQRPSLWKDLKSYGGLMLDAFLLPQILFNGFSNSDAKSLAASFYVGHSFVRLLPHAYDLYRSHSYGKILDWSFIYASHKVDYYSTAWDVIILCVGFLFAVLVFLQQRFGGRCFIPKRWFTEDVRYEKVVELQQTGELHKSNDFS
ncbi:hypothetical protein Rs2_07453 [Raphanus sativus]|nr:hypothetical protein Rs2_07453 [Raphanus sativus]